MKITQTDIAKMLGVTRTTVARALNNSGPVNTELKERIVALSKDLGYQADFKAKTLRMQKQIAISVYLTNYYNSYFLDEVIQGLKLAKNELKYENLVLNVHVLHEKTTQGQMHEILRLIQNENPEGIITIPLTEEAFEPIYSICKQDGILIASLDMKLENFKPTFHVGPDYYAAGRLAGSLMKKFTKHKGKILLLTPTEKFYSLEQRKKGFIEVVKENSSMDIQHIEVSLDSEWIKKSVIETATANQEISGIYSTVKIDGLPEILSELGLTRKVKLIANDLFPNLIKYLKEDAVDAAIYFRPFLQGKVSLLKMFEMLVLNKKETEDISTHFDIVLDENVDLFNNPIENYKRYF